MAVKRKHADAGDYSKRSKQDAGLEESHDEDHDGAHTAPFFGPRKEQQQQQHKQNHKHKRRHPPQHEREPSDLPPLHVIKSKIRSITRLLRNSERLPADARVAKERELAEYERDLAELEARKHRARMISKYHFVRFLDRKTATKTLKKLLREKAALEKDEKTDKEDLERLERNIHIAEVDLNFTIYYPLMTKYVSLFPKKGDEQENEKNEEQKTKTITPTTEKPKMWWIVEKCMAEGTLNDLREDRLNVEDEVKEKTKNTGEKKQSDSKSKSKTEKTKESKKKDKDDPEKKKTKSKGGKKEKKGKEKQKEEQETGDDGGESDGGFFESF